MDEPLVKSIYRTPRTPNALKRRNQRQRQVELDNLRQEKKKKDKRRIIDTYA